MTRKTKTLNSITAELVSPAGEPITVTTGKLDDIPDTLIEMTSMPNAEFMKLKIKADRYDQLMQEHPELKDFFDFGTDFVSAMIHEKPFFEIYVSLRNNRITRNVWTPKDEAVFIEIRKKLPYRGKTS